MSTSCSTAKVPPDETDFWSAHAKSFQFDEGIHPMQVVYTRNRQGPVNRWTQGLTLTAGLAAAVAFAQPSMPVQAASPCTVATPMAGTPVPAASPAAPIPTQAPAAAEQNPPGDIPDNQAFVTYTNAQGGYSITMPEGWARQENGTDVSFTDKLHTFSVAISCASQAPTSATVQADAQITLPAQIPAFELVSVKDISLPSGPAVLVQYRQNSAPDDVTGKEHRLDVDRYEIFSGGSLATITLENPAGSDNVDVSRQVSESFTWAK